MAVTLWEDKAPLMPADNDVEGVPAADFKASCVRLAALSCVDKSQLR